MRLPDRGLRLGLATVLAMSGAKLLDLPDVTLIPIAAVGLALIVLVETRRLNGRVAALERGP